MKRRIFTFLILLFGIYLIISLSRSVWNLWQSGKRIQEAEMKVEKLKAYNLKLKEEVAESKSPEYIEKMAREKLNMAFPGETLIIISEELKKPPEREKENIPHWQRWWKLFF